MRLRPNLLLASVALLAGLLLLGGCSRGASPQEVVNAAAEKTTGAKTSRLALDVDVSGRASQQISVNGQGAFDYANRRGTLNLTLPLGGRLARIESVIVGDVVYQKYPPELARQLPGSKPWLKLDLAEISRRGGNFGGLSQGQAGDPTQALQFLKGAADDVTKVGEEQVRGADTTHYRATLDLGRAAEQAGNDKAAVDRLIKQLGSRTVPADLWIDEEGRLRKMRYEVAFQGSGGQNPPAQGKAATTIELFDFGTEVRATPPPADQVVDATNLLSRQ